VLVVPAIDLERGRSRVVFWPGAASGTGAPTDRPEVIAKRFVELGASLVHLVDFDGARAGKPVNIEAIGAIASRIAVPLQVAGGVDGPDQIRIAFAAGATRVVLGTAVIDQPDVLRECVSVAGDWLAVGLDPRPDRLSAFPWRRPTPPALAELAGELLANGVRRVVLSHGGSTPDIEALSALIRNHDLEVFVAGGVTGLEAVRRLRDAGIAGIILGEALLSGAIDFPTALEAAAA
jgi:phosphoribosylformimino-5-aminoimidazole carboxamide ribotide isomerase